MHWWPMSERGALGFAVARKVLGRTKHQPLKVPGELKCHHVAFDELTDPDTRVVAHRRQVDGSVVDVHFDA